MAASVFEGWLNAEARLIKEKTATIEIFGQKASWHEVLKHAKRLSTLLSRDTLYIIEADIGLQSIVALFAVSITPGASFLWAKKESLPYLLKPLAQGIWVGPSLPLERQCGRSYFGTLTSGSTDTPKIPMGFADSLPLIGLHYNSTLFHDTLPNANEGGCIACCLPLEYSATFMMAILPAWFAKRSLVIFRPSQWSLILKRSQKEPITVIAVPSLLSAATAAAKAASDYQNLTFLITAGYLTKKRLTNVKEKFKNALIRSSYGASETGVMTLDLAPEGLPHVGKKLYGKSVWLMDMNEHEIGKVATSGIDAREFYLNNNQNIRTSDGIVSSTDLGHFDEAGNLYLDGRIDQGEKLYGITIYPKQIELHILKLDTVVDVKVKIQTEKQGIEYLEALVVGDCKYEELKAHCSSLHPSLQPREFIIKTEQEIVYSERGKL